MQKLLSSLFGDRVREYVLVIIVATLQSLMISIMFTVVPLLATSVGATESQMGGISMMPALIAVGMSLPAGAFSTKYGKKASFLASALVSTAGGLLFYSAGSIRAMILPQLLLGIGNVLFWPTEKAYLTELAPERRRAETVGYSMAITVGLGTLGPIAAGYLIDTSGFRSAHLLFISFATLCIAFSAALPRGERQTNVSLAGGLGHAAGLLKRPVILVTSMTTFLQFAALSVVEYFIPAFLRQNGFSATLIGSTVSLRNAGMTVSRLFIGKLTRRASMLTLLFLALAVCAVSGGLIPVMPTRSYVIIGSCLVGAAFGLAPVLTAAVIATQTSTSERNLAMGLDSTVMYGGRICTGLVVGGVAEAVGYGTAIVLANGVVLVGLAGVSLMHARNVRKAAQSGSDGVDP